MRRHRPVPVHGQASDGRRESTHRWGKGLVVAGGRGGAWQGAPRPAKLASQPRKGVLLVAGTSAGSGRRRADDLTGAIQVRTHRHI